MIIADGCDLIEIERIAKALQRENFCTRIYTAEELRYAESKKDLRKAASLAAVFAAKEAVAKALGVGLGQIGWSEIEVRHDELGKPFVALSGRARALAEERGVKNIHLSLSHSREYALAMVILEG